MQHRPITPPSLQQGISLIEMLVGIVIGLLTVAVAMTALMVSRSVTGTVTDNSQLQQQASYAFRVIGQQLRQAGSLRLNLAIQKSESEVIDVSDPVAFETQSTNFTPELDTIQGIDRPGNGAYKLTTGYSNYQEPVYTSSTDASMLRDCLGQQPSAFIIQSNFVLDATSNELKCAGASGAAQAIIQNVANFEIRYLWQTNASTGQPQISYVQASDIGTQWPQVVGVEICLVLYGNEAIDMPDNTTYISCDGSIETMNTLATPRTRRVHMVFKNVYQIRSQGLTSVS